MSTLPCEACTTDLAREFHSEVHCLSPTCDWIKCNICGAINWASGIGHFYPKRHKDKRKNG